MDVLFIFRPVIAALCVAAWFPPAAFAQDKVGIALSAGVLTARDAAPLGEFQRPLLAVVVQRVFWNHFVLEGELTHWTYLRHLEFPGPRNITDSRGVIGTVTGSETNSSHKLWNYGVNAMVKSTGRVRFFAGGGLGMSYDDNDYWQQTYGCSPSLDPRLCQRFDQHYDRGGFVIRGLGGVEIPITPRVGLTSSIRAETTSWEDRNEWLSATAGIRFAFD
jgi:hypothetical protein